jgi:hypothetical protein
MAAPLHLSTAEILLLLKVRAGMSLTYAVAVATVVIVAAQQSSGMFQPSLDTLVRSQQGS